MSVFFDSGSQSPAAGSLQGLLNTLDAPSAFTSATSNDAFDVRSTLPTYPASTEFGFGSALDTYTRGISIAPAPGSPSPDSSSWLSKIGERAADFRRSISDNLKSIRSTFESMMREFKTYLHDLLKQFEAIRKASMEALQKVLANINHDWRGGGGGYHIAGGSSHGGGTSNRSAVTHHGGAYGARGGRDAPAASLGHGENGVVAQPGNGVAGMQGARSLQDLTNGNGQTWKRFQSDRGKPPSIQTVDGQQMVVIERRVSDGNTRTTHTYSPRAELAGLEVKGSNEFTWDVNLMGCRADRCFNQIKQKEGTGAFMMFGVRDGQVFARCKDPGSGGSPREVKLGPVENFMNGTFTMHVKVDVKSGVASVQATDKSTGKVISGAQWTIHPSSGNNFAYGWKGGHYTADTNTIQAFGNVTVRPL